MVPASWLDVDVFVFAETEFAEMPQLVGWCSTDQVELMPRVWVEEKGERVDYVHDINQRSIIELPDEFDFVDPCGHQRQFGMLWDYGVNAWECCGCGRHVYNEADSDHIERYDAKHYPGV